MAKNIVNSRGVTITIKIGTGTAVKIGGVTAFSGIGSGAASIIDVTDLDSTAKEKVTGVMDEGQFKMDYNLIKGDPGQAALDAARASGALCELKVATSAVVYGFDASIMTNEKSGAVDKQMTGSATAEISGSVIQTPVAA